ncbi:MAG TPA: hypothetical protein VMJ10_17400, partial [Kofleriaceae bacterium]|nr:hypothetical protein [Kofleriaceae bacterium]
FDLGGAKWIDRAVVGPDRSARIAGIPAGNATTGLAGTGDRTGHIVAGDIARDGATVKWPGGATLDVVTASPGEVVVVRGYVEARSDHAKVSVTGGPDFALAPAGPIGFSTETPEGRRVYARGDLHAVLRDIAPGPVSVCFLAGASSKCMHLVVPPGTATMAVSLK